MGGRNRMKVSLTRAARRDLQKIKEYLSPYGKEPLKQFGSSFKRFRSQVSTMPYMFPQFGFNRRYRVASLIFDYLVYYEVNDRTIEIFRILHSKQNIPRILPEDDSDG